MASTCERIRLEQAGNKNYAQQTEHSKPRRTNKEKQTKKDKRRRTNEKERGRMVPKRGLEPPRGYPHYHLKVACLPIPPLRHASRNFPTWTIDAPPIRQRLSLWRSLITRPETCNSRRRWLRYIPTRRATRCRRRAAIRRTVCPFRTGGTGSGRLPNRRRITGRGR